MRKTILTILIIIITLPLAAQQVTLSEAITVAINVMKRNGQKQTKDKITKIGELLDGNNVLIYEVIFDNGNYVLLSGNKSCLPVLVYSLSEDNITNKSLIENLENLPNGLRNILDEYAEQIKYSFQNNIICHFDSKWNDFIECKNTYFITSEVVSPLIHTRWGQSYSNDSVDLAAYNYFITESSIYCNKCMTGCVATAMAQIMKYWNYPFFNPNKSKQFDWCNMPDSLLTFRPNYEKERDAVAHLMRECGLSVNMWYCISGCASGIPSGRVPEALVGFGFSDDAVYKKKNLFTNSSWMQRIKANLNTGYPVFYSGTDNSYGSHAFICDGYRSDNTFHFNFGFNGKYDEFWFTLDLINPHYFDFTSKQAAVFNIHPAYSQDYCNNFIFLNFYYNIYYNVNGNTTPAPYNNIPGTASVLYSGYSDGSTPSSWYTIPASAKTEYVAHNDIWLLHGFVAEEGCDFIAYIEPCASCEENMENPDPLNIVSVLLPDSLSDTNHITKMLQSDIVYNDETTLKVYPNPADDILNIELHSAGISSLTLFDLQGRAVATARNTQKNTARLHIGGLQRGVYLLRVTDYSGKNHQAKIVKR